jgi:hypothetical protein
MDMDFDGNRLPDLSTPGAGENLPTIGEDDDDSSDPLADFEVRGGTTPGSLNNPYQPLQPLVPTTPAPRTAPPPAGLSPAEVAAVDGIAMLDRGDVYGAIGALERAELLSAAAGPWAQVLRARIGRTGTNRVGILLQQGDCAGAQRLYLRLRRFTTAAASQFGDWCPVPR